MKRVLIITYYWPPSGGAGVQRWLKFSKYLPGFGWKPIIYTPENPENPVIDHSLEKDVSPQAEIIRTKVWEPYHFYKKFVGLKKEDKIATGFLSEKKKSPLLENIAIWIRGNFFIPDARKFWINPSVRYLIRYLKNNPVDAIVSTGPPHSMHLIGYQIHQKTNIPWIADFRDPWTDIDFYHQLKLSKRADSLHKKLEKKVLMTADKVVVISNGMKEQFRGLYDRDYDVITNGFDEDDLPKESVVMDQKFSISHIGSLVPARNPEVLWKALSELATEIPGFRDDLEIKLVGKVDISVIESLKNHGLYSNLAIIDYLPHNQVTLVQLQSQILLLLINNAPNSRSILTGKLFEYLAAKRPIVCIGPTDGDAAEIIKKSGSGVSVDFEDIERLENEIRRMYSDFKENKLTTHNQNIDRYSRFSLTAEIVEQLNTILD